jgi:hypothetical protein
MTANRVFADMVVWRSSFKREETRDSVLIQRLMSQYTTLGYVEPVGKFQTKVMKVSHRVISYRIVSRMCVPLI